MYRTPGIILPSAYSNPEDFKKELHRRDKEAGFIPFESSISDEDPIEHSNLNVRRNATMIVSEKQKPSLADLSHHGVKGMHWGVTRNSSGGGGNGAQPSRRDLKKMDKANVKADKAKYNKEIDDARTRYGAALDKANAQYETERKTLGKYQAEKNFQETMSKHLADRDTAIMTKYGSESIKTTLAVVGAVGIAAIIGGLAGRK